MNMKFLCGVLVLVCVLQVYLLQDAKKNRIILQDSLAAIQNNYIDRDIIDIKIKIKLASEIVANPENALKIINNVICSGNPFPDNYLQIRSVPEDMIERMKILKTEVTTHCKN